MIVKRMLVATALLVAGVVAFAFAPSVLRAQEATPESTPSLMNVTTCNVPFEATVRQGASSGTDLKGTLQATIDATGALTGNVVIDADTSFPVYGQVNGRAINMALDLSTAKHPGVYVFGVGTAIDPIQSATCGTALGGPFVGPTPGDSGDWLAGGSLAIVVTPAATGSLGAESLTAQKVPSPSMPDSTGASARMA